MQRLTQTLSQLSNPSKPLPLSINVIPSKYTDATINAQAAFRNLVALNRISEAKKVYEKHKSVLEEQDIQKAQSLFGETTFGGLMKEAKQGEKNDTTYRLLLSHCTHRTALAKSLYGKIQEKQVDDTNKLLTAMYNESPASATQLYASLHPHMSTTTTLMALLAQSGNATRVSQLMAAQPDETQWNAYIKAHAVSGQLAHAWRRFSQRVYSLTPDTLKAVISAKGRDGIKHAVSVFHSFNGIQSPLCVGALAVVYAGFGDVLSAFKLYSTTNPSAVDPADRVILAKCLLGKHKDYFKDLIKFSGISSNHVFALLDALVDSNDLKSVNELYLIASSYGLDLAPLNVLFGGNVSENAGKRELLYALIHAQLSGWASVEKVLADIKAREFALDNDMLEIAHSVVADNARNALVKEWVEAGEVPRNFDKGMKAALESSGMVCLEV